MKKILVVDDDPGVQLLLGRRLEAEGFTVIAATDGHQGFSRCVEELPDLMVWDVMMPGQDGYNGFRECRHDSRTAHIPVIILTAKEELEEIFRMERVEAFLAKPVNMEDFIHKVCQLTGRERMAEGLAPLTDFSRVRALVVDDDLVFLKLMESFMARLGCRAVLCRSGREALEKMRSYNFDVCFMDIMMPDMNGVEAASVIREEYTRRLPIIAITSSAMKATRDKCLDVGMNDFISKPVSLDQVKDFISRYALRCP